MGQEVATLRNGSSSVAKFGDDMWSQFANEYGNDSAGVQYVKFDGTLGNYTIGATKETVEEGTQVAINMLDFRTGFICWKDKEVVDTVSVSFAERMEGSQPVSKADLRDHGPYKKYPNGASDGWVEQFSVSMRLLDDGTEAEFKTTSGSGIRAMKKLLSDYVAGRKIHGDAIPVVELGITSFVPKNAGPGTGKKFAPVFNIVGWKTEEELNELLDEIEEENASAATAEEEEIDTTPQPVAPPPKAEVPAAPARRARGRF